MMEEACQGRGQLCGVTSLPPLHGFQGSYLDCQAYMVKHLYPLNHLANPTEDLV